MLIRDEEFHEVSIVLEHIFDASGVSNVTLAFCFPFWTKK